MKKTNKLTVDYLTAVYYDNGMDQYTLVFDNEILLDVDASEFEGYEVTDSFFEDEENLKKAIEEGKVRSNILVKDLINDIVYAEGSTEDEIVSSWNENLEDKFDWIINSGNFFEGDEEYNQLKKLFDKVTEEAYDTENIKDVINTLNEAYDSQFIEAIADGKALEWSNVINTLVDKKYYNPCYADKNKNKERSR